MSVYLIDANIFIEANNRYYGLNFCPAFWDWLIIQNKAGKVASVEKVAEELLDEKIKTWAEARGASFFLAPDGVVLDKLQIVSNWVKERYLESDERQKFLEGADYWLIAHALAHSHTVVTQERASDSPKRPKIPTVCDGLGVNCIDLYEMLRRGKAKFVLESEG